MSRARTMSFPLVAVDHEVVRDQWDRESRLVCGHIVKAPQAWGRGAGPAKRRRCGCCATVNKGETVHESWIWDADKAAATVERLAPKEAP